MVRALLASACIFSACAVGFAEPVDYESFEEGVPGWFAAARPESLTVSSRHSKQGNRSLRWDWRQGEALVIRHGIGDVDRRGGLGNNNRASFAVWVYAEQPVADALVFEFRDGARVAGSFRFPLEFTGWRQGRPIYASFLSGKPAARVDNIRIAAPRTVSRGTVFLDLVKYNTLSLRPCIAEKEARWRRPIPDERRFPKPERLTEAERSGIRQLLGRDEGSGIGETAVKALCDRVNALGIVRDAQGVRGGPGIDRLLQYCCEFGDRGAKTQEYWIDEHGPDWLGMQSPKTISALALQLATAHRASRDGRQRRRLADAFLLLEDYLYDQGMQAGTGFHWNWWYGGQWADAVYLMRDVLAEAGRLPRQCDYFLWNWGGAEIFAETDPPSYMDFYTLDVPRLMRACLMQPEVAEQVRWLRAFKRMLERSILQPTSALKIDGCAYHHGGHYFHYAFAAVPALAATLHELSGTPWRLDADAHERVRRALLAQRLFCNQRDMPLSLSGRMPFVEYSLKILPQGLDCLARSGTPDAVRDIDPLAAAAYLRLAPEAAKREPYRSRDIGPEPEPNGCFVMPYAALVSHRRDNWLASVHGQSKYVWGTERQSKVNCFGLFQGLGHLEILAGGNPVNVKDSGEQRSGWDWRRFEGTTVPQFPLELIDKKWTTAYSPETFAGGLAHRGQGIFAMIVNQPVPGGKTLKARKSWFFNDDRILCLGSDIACDEVTYPTQTTLCQKCLFKDKNAGFVPTLLDGSRLTAFPEERALDDAQPHWFLDVQQTGYCLPAGQKVTLARRHQTSREYQDQGDTEGDFLTAWIDHGKAPAAAGYEYLLAVRASPAAMRELAAQSPYRVVQRDRDAHLAWHPASRRWSCVFFAPQQVRPHALASQSLPVRAVDRPCLVMADPARDGVLDITVADPDLNLGKKAGVSGDNGGWFPLPSRPLRLTLHGVWRLVDTSATVCAWPLPEASQHVRVLSAAAGETVVELRPQHGASYALRLAR